MNLYKPQGVPRSDLQEVILKVEELEAIRLKDLLGLEQEESAQQMQVSRSTFQRVLNDARYKIAKALIKGNAIRIEGGDYCLGEGYCRRHERYLRGNEVCVRGREILTVKDAQRADKSWRRVAICSSGTSPLSPIDERFGRCAYFMVWDPLTKQYTSLVNSGIKAGHGMGLDAIQALIETKVGFVLTQRIGVNAFTVLKEKGIKVFSGGTGKTVETVLKSYENGEMRELRNANG